MQIPWLSILILLPLATGIVLLVIPAGKRNTDPLVSAGCCSGHLCDFACCLFLTYNKVSCRISIHRENGLAAGAGDFVPRGCGRHQRGAGIDGGHRGAGGVLVTWQTSETARGSISPS